MGDGCILDAGVAILAGTKIGITPKELSKIQEVNSNLNLEGEVLKGRDLAGLNGIHFRQNSQTGEITASRSTKEVKLNTDLH